MTINIQPLGDRVLMKAIAVEDKTDGGIILVQTAQEKPNMAEILAVGSGTLLQDGTRIPPIVQVGAKVLFAKYSCIDHKQGGQEYLICREGDLIAVIG